MDLVEEATLPRKKETHDPFKSTIIKFWKLKDKKQQMATNTR